MKRQLNLEVNGERREVLVAASRTLLEVLRYDLQLTGTKEVCTLGACGACTVLLDGKAVLSCLTLAAACKNKKIVTIEGLAQGDALHPLQQSFIDNGAVQCGFCTPGMILTGKALLDEHPHPTAAQVREAISGNLCRCTGYAQIVDAIVGAPEATKDAKPRHRLPRSGPYLMPEIGE